MNWTRVAMTVGLVGLAANLLMNTRRAAPIDADDGLEPFPSVDAGLPARIEALTAGAAAASETGTADTGLPGTAGDSPNQAERLQASGVAAASDGGGASGDLFKSTSQESPYARAPGLPDFARGA